VSACSTDVPVLGDEGVLDGVEGDDLFEEGEHFIARFGVWEIGELCVSAEEQSACSLERGQDYIRPGDNGDNNDPHDHGGFYSIRHQICCQYTTKNDSNPQLFLC